MDSTFNRVINSTFGLPQQLVWRIWRALKEEDVDLFSKEGLLDPALTPVLGMAFSHANDVEPEEMFGENVWAQLGGSVVTDPLSFLFSAPTLAAKGAHAATKIARSGRLAEFASTEAGVGRMLYGDFKDAAQKAAAKISNPKASRKFQALIDALPSDPNINTVADLMKRGRDHDLLVGAPLIGKATGLSIRVPTYANSWFEMLHSGNKKLVGMAASLAKPMRAIPGVADMFDSLASAGRAISQGRSAATFAPVVGALPDALGHFLTPEMASHVITNSTDLGARLLPRRAKMASLFAKAQAQGKTNEQALAIALGIRPTEKGLARARELYGSILDPTGTLSQEIRIPQTAAELEKNTGLFYGAIQQAQAAISGAEAAVVGGFSKDALQFPGLFKLSKSVTSGLRRRFISDLNLKGDAIQAAERTRKIHQNSILQGAEQVTRDLQEGVRAAADQLGVRPELVHGLMASFAELDPAADEVIEHLRHMGGNSKDALASLNALTDQLVSRAPATLEQAKLQIRNALKGEGVTEQGHAFLQRLLDDIEATVRGSPFDEKVPFVPQALDAEKVTTGGVEFTRPVDLLRPWRHNMVSGGKRVKGRRVGSMTNTEIMEAQVDLEKRLSSGREVKESTRLGYQRDLEALEAELLDRNQTFDAAGRKLDLSNGRPEELMNREAEIFGRTPTRTRTVPAKQPDSILDLEFVGEVTPLAERVVRLDDARRQMIRWIRQNDGATAMPAAMLEEYTHRLEEYSGSFRKVLRDNLGGDYNVFDAFEDYQRHVLNEAVKGGLIKPGFPLASFTRLLDPEAQIEVNKILGALPQDQVVKINPTMSGFYMRHTNRMSLQELVELNRTLLEEGSEAGKQVGEKLGSFLAAQGYDINKVFTDDPISALTNRLLEVQTAKTNEEFFNAVAGFKESAEAGVLTGKVVGYVDDSMNTVKFDKRVLERTKYADEFDETDVLLEGADVLPSEGTEYLGPGVKRMEDNYRGIVVETREGRQMVIPSAMIGNGYSLNQFATDVPAEDFGKAVVASIARNRHGKYTALPRGADLAAMNGQYIMYGPTGAVDSIVGAVGQQAKDGGPLIKTIYDPIHTAVKMFQTVLRIPEFHFVNLVSAFSQMGLQGVGPKQMTRGMWHAMRFLSAEPELVNKYDRFIRFTAEAGTSKTGIGRRLKTPLSMEFERSARRRAFVGAEDALDDLSNVFQFGDQRVTIREFLQAGIESGGLTGTFAQEGLRSTGSLSSALRGIREQAFATGAKRAVGQTVEAARGVGESSELFARLGGVFAMLESGATLETAWKATTEAMVDYGALTNFEKNVMKRVSSFYTFPRKFVPYAWKEIGKDPSKAALTLNAAFKSSFVHTETGRTELNMGEHRFNLERVMPQMMIPQLMASVADRLFDIRGDTAEGRVGDIMEPSGLLQVAGFEHFLPGRSDGFPQKSAMDRALNLTYLTKWIIQRDNPEVHRSALDEIADKAFGIRKVRPEHERRLLATNYRRLISDLQYQAEREPDAEDRQALLQEAQEIAHTVQALMEK